ncbi:MAG: radical SAM/SPASM domain-containing protein [Candidatus Thorarchaeota archaeon]
MESREEPSMTEIFSKLPITVDPAKLVKWYSEEAGPIFYLMFGITYECQCNCRHCCTGNYIKEKHRDLTTDEIKDVLDQAAKPLIVNFFGGEPTLRPDLMELIEYATERSMYVFTDTNGLKVTKDYAQQLKDSGLELLYVSIDSPVPELHDKYRGVNGCFDKAVGAIKNALDVGLKCVISTYMTKESLANGDFEKVIQMSKDMGTHGVRYLLPTPAGKWLHETEVMLTPEEKGKVWALTDFPYVCRDFYFQTQFSSQCRGVADKAYMYISPYGDVQPCCFMPLSFGNIREDPLKTVLDRMYQHPMYSHECMEHQCPMIDRDFRKHYIDTIPDDAKLPFRMDKELN